jgi:hypothetical protein
MFVYLYVNDIELAQSSNIEKNMKTPKKPYSSWKAVPCKEQPNSFILETKDGKEVCTLVFNDPAQSGYARLIAAAPELEDIAEMFHDHMLGSRMKQGMIFDIVKQTLTATGSFVAEV